MGVHLPYAPRKLSLPVLSISGGSLARESIIPAVHGKQRLRTVHKVSLPSNYVRPRRNVGGMTQQWKATMPAGTNGRRFVRLRVTRR